jgi:hypothetical protein
MIWMLLPVAAPNKQNPAALKKMQVDQTMPVTMRIAARTQFSS